MIKAFIFTVPFLIIFMCKLSFGDAGLWEEYKSKFINEDGRVIDFYNKHTSHSEGQSYGMALAVKFNELDTFDKLWKWTRDNLSVREDNLFAWQWGEKTDGKWGVIDYNNATDGDVLLALTLLEAERKWPGNGYKDNALTIIKSIRENLAIHWEGNTLLLPGYFGFTNNDTLTLNPSYFIFPTYRRFAKVDESLFWKNVYKSSINILTKSCFGSMHLPSDWIGLNNRGVFAHNEKPPHFGYDAIRTLFYLAQEDSFPVTKGLKHLLDIYRRLGYLPLWVNVVNDSISLKDAPAGFYAVIALTAKKIGEPELSKKLFKNASDKLDKNDYYTFSLYLLAVTGGFP